MSTPSQSELFLNEAFDLIGNTTIIGLFSGVVFVLYCLCAQSLYLQLQEPDKGRQARFTLGYITLIFFFTITVLALSARMAQLTYVEHADFPGGPINYEKSYNPTTNSYETTTAVFSLIVVVLTMAIQVGRSSKPCINTAEQLISLDLAVVGCMEWNEICFNNHHSTSVAPPIFHRYVNNDSWVRCT